MIISSEYMSRPKTTARYRNASASWSVEKTHKALSRWTEIVDPEEQYLRDNPIRSDDCVSVSSEIDAPVNTEKTPSLDRFLIACSSDVLPFLADKPAIVSALLESVPFIEAVFGQGAAVSLEVIRDPEQDEDAVLFASVHTSLDVDNAISSLRSFKQAWWYPVRGEFGRFLNFDVEID